MEIFRLLIICLIAAFLSIVLKQKGSEFAFLLTVFAGLIVVIAVLNQISLPIKELAHTVEGYGIETEYFKVALKAVGIAYVTDFIADSCRDSGQNSMAAKAELVGKSAIFVLSVPLLMSVLETAIGFIK